MIAERKKKKKKPAVTVIPLPFCSDAQLVLQQLKHMGGGSRQVSAIVGSRDLASFNVFLENQIREKL